MDGCSTIFKNKARLGDNEPIKSKPLKAETHQSNSRRLSTSRRLTSTAVCLIQHVESASGPSAIGRTRALILNDEYILFMAADIDS